MERRTISTARLVEPTVSPRYLPLPDEGALVLLPEFGVGVVEPGVVAPGVVDPGVVDPGVVDPGVVAPGVVVPLPERGVVGVPLVPGALHGVDGAALVVPLCGVPLFRGCCGVVVDPLVLDVLLFPAVVVLVPFELVCPRGLVVNDCPVDVPALVVLLPLGVQGT